MPLLSMLFGAMALPPVLEVPAPEGSRAYQFTQQNAPDVAGNAAHQAALPWARMAWRTAEICLGTSIAVSDVTSRSRSS